MMNLNLKKSSSCNFTMTNWHRHCWCQPFFLPLVGESLFAMFGVFKATSSFPPSSSPPASESSFICNVLHFQTHWPTPPSFLPPVSESSLATCHVSELTNLLLPLSPFQQVSPHFAPCHISELTNPLLPLPPLQQVSPHFATCHISELTNPFLPLPPPGRDLVCNVPHF